MMRKSPVTAMQKTYDECYLVCSTAIYFEGQNNEPEALRAWRNALDQIYYHNAYRMPSAWTPRTETEKALLDSLRAMELQCKERVDLLEALRRSRVDTQEDANGSGDIGKSNGEAHSKGKGRHSGGEAGPSKSSGDMLSFSPAYAFPQASISDGTGASSTNHSAKTTMLRGEQERDNHGNRQAPRQAKRPTYGSGNKVPSSEHVARTTSNSHISHSLTLSPSPSLAPPPIINDPRTRTPSPEKKGGMLKTLRSNPKERAASSSSASGKMAASIRNRAPPAAAKAASQVWPISQQPQNRAPSSEVHGGSTTSMTTAATTTTWNPFTRTLVSADSQASTPLPSVDRRVSEDGLIRPPSPSDFNHSKLGHGSLGDVGKMRSYPPPCPDYPAINPYARQAFAHSDESLEAAKQPPPPPPPHRPQDMQQSSYSSDKPRPPPPSLSQLGPASSFPYMKEYPNHPPAKPKPPAVPPTRRADRALDSESPSSSAPHKIQQASSSPTIPRKAVGIASASVERKKLDDSLTQLQSRVKMEPLPFRTDFMGSKNSSPEPASRTSARRNASTTKKQGNARTMTPPSSDESPDADSTPPTSQQAWAARVAHILANLPPGIDPTAAAQILNEIVIHGDEVHWSDVAGLEIAKSALKETVVYPFLRPDLFLGLREPARGMLLFGPPGTGKTMLARAVATESHSIFFAISASSLTSKYLGESEKLVRALFVLAKALAPSIIFVDEIDSLLSARGGSSEHEATRRIKTEFLIQWSDLQKAAAGREDKNAAEKEKGDASRVLVLAATNLPWAIDEAARRRFVRRQYIPLPEAWVREQQLRTLLAAQKHSLRPSDFEVLVRVTEGFSGSDITALTKDAAMGPLRSLGEKLLSMRKEEIRGIEMQDFEKSLVNIRPSVGREGLRAYEEWAREFGERGG